MIARLLPILYEKDLRRKVDKIEKIIISLVVAFVFFVLYQVVLSINFERKYNVFMKCMDKQTFNHCEGFLK